MIPKRVLTTFTLLILFTATSVESFNWSKVVTKIERSTVAIQIMDEGTLETICTGFSIRDNVPFYMTAAHCIVEDGNYIDGKRAGIIYFDNQMDVVILVGSVGRPAVRPRKAELRVGAEVGAYGYGLGHERPFFRAGNVSDVNHPIPELSYYVQFGWPDWSREPFLIVDQISIGGMSGGPIFDTDGRVVSLTQLGFDAIGISASRMIADILAATGEYWQHKP